MSMYQEFEYAYADFDWPWPRNPYIGVNLVNPDPLAHHPLYELIKRPANALIDRNTTFFTDLPYYWSGGDDLFSKQYPIDKLGHYISTSDLGFAPLDMKYTESGQVWNEFTESTYYFNFTGTFHGNQKSLVNLMLGHYIHGTGPINYVFPVNGEVSRALIGSQIVRDAFSKWESVGSPDNWHKKIEFTLERQEELMEEDKILSIENFVGSADFTINYTSDTTIIMRIYNVTSITSGDLSKHMPGGIWMPSIVADPNNKNTQPYSNILQIYQLKWTRVYAKNKDGINWPIWLVFNL